MNRKRTALSFAAAGTAAGVVGLVFLAAPADAGEAPPALPKVSADDLVQSVLSIKQVPALAGTVEMQNDLGLPLPGLPATSGGGDAVHVYSDGHGRGRISMARQDSETTVIDDGKTVWVWDSSDKSVTKVPHGAKKTPMEGKFADPAKAARDLVGAMEKDSTVDVDGTARVADRPAYQLVLTPKPTERTLLREVRISVDSQTRVPLQLEVLANGQSDPALKVGFTDFTAGAQDAKLFQFTPPAGAKVEQHDPDKELKGHSPDQLFDQLDLKTVGEGWDTVLTGTLPKDAMNGDGGNDGNDGDHGNYGGHGANPLELLGKFGKEVHGDFGTGYVIKSSVGTALITEDGKVALGAVPQQVVVDALSK